jgi:hypothetical protein
MERDVRIKAAVNIDGTPYGSLSSSISIARTPDLVTTFLHEPASLERIAARYASLAGGRVK